MRRALIVLLCLVLTGCAAPAETVATTTAATQTEAVTEAVMEAVTEAATETVTEAATEAVTEAVTEPQLFTLVFEAVDREGNTWTQEDFADCKVIILNFWEPWCGPCVGEMPALEQLYQDYKDRGLLVIGVYSTDGMEDEVDLTLSDSGVTYPILRYTDAFAPLQTGYVPTTALFNGNWELLGQPFAGAQEYDGWAALAEQMLQ